MAFSSALITSTDHTKYLADRPMLCGHNILRGDGATITAKWTAAGTKDGSDIVATGYPCTRLYDGFVHLDTRPDAADQVRYLNFSASADVAFNYFFMHLNPSSLHASSTITLEVCTDGDGYFSPATAIEPIAATSYVAGAYRCFYPEVRISGDNAGDQRLFSGMRYWRVGFDAGAGNTHTPQVNEIMIGLSTQLHHYPYRPFDKYAQIGAGSVFQSRNGVSTEYINFVGKKFLSADLVLASDAQVTAINTWHGYTGYGVRPFLWSLSPYVDVQAWLMRLRSFEEFSLPEVDVNEHPYKLEAEEQGGRMVVDE